MRQANDTTYDRATAIIHAVNDAELVIVKAIEASMGRTRNLQERAHAITQALDKAGFDIRYRPLDIVPETTEERVEFARRTGNWDGISDRDYRTWLRSLSATIPGTEVTLTPEGERAIQEAAAAPATGPGILAAMECPWPIEEPDEGPFGIMISRTTTDGVTTTRTARLEPGGRETETEKAARWASVLIAQILEDGSARQAEAGVETAAKDAQARLKRDRGRMAFEDIDRTPPAAASLADFLLATWARALGDTVEWCEGRLGPRRLVYVARLRRPLNDAEIKELNHRLRIIDQMNGVVGSDWAGCFGLDLDIAVRFDYYITTLGCEYTPIDLPARPITKAA